SQWPTRRNRNKRSSEQSVLSFIAGRSSFLIGELLLRQLSETVVVQGNAPHDRPGFLVCHLIGNRASFLCTEAPMVRIPETNFLHGITSISRRDGGSAAAFNAIDDKVRSLQGRYIALSHPVIVIKAPGKPIANTCLVVAESFLEHYRQQIFSQIVGHIALVHLAIGRFAHRLGLVHLRQRLTANLLRPSQVATGRIVPLTGLLGLLDLVVVAEVEPLQT